MPRLPASLRTLAMAGVFSIAAAVQSPISAQRTLAQAFHTSWGENEGLPYFTMDRAMRSPDGYLWLGSDGPLVRFDGVHFTVFDGTNTPILASGTVGGIRPGLIARDGTMWVVRADGALVRYRDGRFERAVPTSAHGSNVTLTQDHAGRIWVFVARSGVQVVQGDALISVSLPSWLPNDELISMAGATGDGVWLGTRTRGIVHLTSTTATTLRPPGVDGVVQPVLETRDGSLWVWARGLHVFRDGRWRDVVTPGLRDQAFVPSGAEAADGAVWIGTRGSGVYRLRGERIEQFTKRDGLSDVVVTAVSVDAEGNTWIATPAGLDRLRPAPFVTVGLAQGLPYEFPVWIAPDASGAVWALSAAARTLYRIDGGIVRDQLGPVTSTTLQNPRASFYNPLAPARAGGLWVYDGSVGAIVRAAPERVVSSGLALPETNAERFLEDSNGSFWAITVGSPLKRSSAGRWLQAGGPADTDLVKLNALVETGGGNVVVAQSGRPGLMVLQDGKVVRRMGPAAGLARPLYSIVADGDTLWAHDRDATLYRIAGTKVSRLTSPELIPLLRSSAALQPASDRIFIATTNAITSLSRAALNAAADRQEPLPPLRYYSALDGARAKGLMTVAPSPVFRAADGRVWFSTPRGLLVYDPRDDVPNTVAPRVHIEEVRAVDSALTLDSIVAIPAGAERVEFRFTVTALRIPERARLEFRLEGVDAQWRTADASRRVTYTQLRPRRYTFRVRAWNEDGVPAVAEAVLPLRVIPRWYETWWFLFLEMVAAVAAIAFVVVAVLHSRARRVQEKLAAGFEATLAERTRLAGELHDTLLQAFTGVTLQLQALRSRMVSQPDDAERDLGRVLVVADVALRDARSAVWDMRAPDLQGRDVGATLEESVREAVDSHVFAGGTHVEVNVTVSGQRRRLSSAVETAAERIAREALVNALHHANAQHISIAIGFGAHHLYVDVRDDGVGFDVSHAHPTEGRGHWGLVGMRERARNAGGTIEVASAPGLGTTVSVHLPIDAA